MSKTKNSIKKAIRTVVTTDPLRQSLTDSLSSVVKCDPLERTPMTDPLGHSLKADNLRPVVETDNSRLSAVVRYNDLRPAVRTRSLVQAMTMDNSEKAATTKTPGKVVTTDNSEKASVIDNFGKTMGVDNLEYIETNKTLHKTKSMDATLKCMEELHNTKPASQNLTKKYHAMDSKFTDFDKVSSQILKPSKFESKPHIGRNDQSNDFHRNKLSTFVDVQQLLNIGYKNPELLPLIKRISVINDIFSSFNYRVKNELVSIIKIAEKTIKEFVYMKQTAYNPDAMQDAVYKLLPKLNKRFCDVVLKHGGFILDPAMKNLVEWNKRLKSLSTKKINSSTNGLFDLSIRFQTKGLIRIANDHPEFRSNIKTILGVNSAMKHLNHNGQVEIYKILRRMEKIIKDLAKQKMDPEGCHDIFLTPETLTSSLDYCIEKILMYLKASPYEPVKCFQCDMDRSHARNDNIGPNIGKGLVANQLMSVFDCANWGVEHDRITNLESLIHHLVAKENALENFWSFQNCINWFEITHQHSKYRLEAIPEMLKIKILRLHILEALDQIEGILVRARSFCAEISHVDFVKNESLSAAIALSGQIEMLTSGMENYLNALAVLTGNVFCLLNEYGVVSLKLRDGRFRFLTKPQWDAFNFPFYVK